MKMKKFFLIFALLTVVCFVRAQIGSSWCCLEFDGGPAFSDNLVEALKAPKTILTLDLSLQTPKLTKIPEQVALLVNLKCLDVSFNRVSEFPENFKTLKNLACLNLSGNMYLQKLPAFLNEMPNLKEVRMEGLKWSIAKQKSTEAEFPNIRFFW